MYRYIDLDAKIEEITDFLIIEDNIDYLNCYIFPFFHKNKIKTVKDLLNANIDEVFKDYSGLGRIWKGKIAALKSFTSGKELATEECLYYSVQKKYDLETFKNELTITYYMLGLDNPSIYFIKKVYEDPTITSIKIIDFIKMENKSKRKDCNSRGLKEFYIQYDHDKQCAEKLKIFSAKNLDAAAMKLAVLKNVNPLILAEIFEEGEIDSKIQKLDKIKKKLHGE